MNGNLFSVRKFNKLISSSSKPYWACYSFPNN